jgi:ABC-type glycerol-3-phosphate transport system substrate-binding protein
VRVNPPRRAITLATLILLFIAPTFARAQSAPSDPNWPAVTVITKPWTRWWWPGNAVDQANISRQIDEFNQAGIGGIEITPIYGVHGAESRNIQFPPPPRTPSRWA